MSFLPYIACAREVHGAQLHDSVFGKKQLPCRGTRNAMHHMYEYDRAPNQHHVYEYGREPRSSQPMVHMDAGEKEVAAAEASTMMT